MDIVRLADKYWPYVILVALAAVLVKSMGVVAAVTVLVIGYFIITYTRRNRAERGDPDV